MVWVHVEKEEARMDRQSGFKISGVRGRPIRQACADSRLNASSIPAYSLCMLAKDTRAQNFMRQLQPRHSHENPRKKARQALFH